MADREDLRDVQARAVLEASAQDFLDGAEEIGRRHGVDQATTLAVMALQVRAVLDGCKDSDEALAWAIRRGYIERVGPGRRTGRTAVWPYRVTDEGLRFAAGLEDEDA